jgi:hypothetical protein
MYEPDPSGSDDETESRAQESAEHDLDARHRASSEIGGTNAASTNAASCPDDARARSMGPLFMT